MEDLAPQLGGILVGGTSTDEPNSQSSLYSASIGVPVTLVVSGGLPDQSDMEVHSNAMLSTLALQSDDGCGPATQLFLEHLADGQARLKTADGHTLEVDVDPGTIGLVHGNSGVPLLLQVSPDGMLLQRDDVQIALAASGAAAENSTDTTEEQREDAGGSTPCEDSEPMFQDAEHLPLRMYFEVAKETADENSASMEDVQTNTGTAVAIVTPDGDESDADELPAPTGRRLERVERLEDFMDVVTTYLCRFCSFSCAWRSGLMSHIRSCHVAPSSSGSLEPVERPVSSRSTVKPASKPTRAGNNPVAFALTTAGVGSACTSHVKALRHRLIFLEAFFSIHCAACQSTDSYGALMSVRSSEGEECCGVCYNGRHCASHHSSAVCESHYATCLWCQDMPVNKCKVANFSSFRSLGIF